MPFGRARCDFCHGVPQGYKIPQRYIVMPPHYFGREAESMDTVQFARLLAMLAVAWLGFAASCSFVRADDAQLLDPLAMQQELQRLAGVCDRIGLESQAKLCRAWFVPPRPDQHQLYLPVPFPEADDTDLNQQRWVEYFVTARRKHARWLYREAQRLADGDDEVAAFQTLWHVLREDPEHVEALRILGPLASAAAVQPQVRSSATPQTDFRWPARSYSRIQTPHFMVTTRADKRQSIAIAKRLEAAHALWCQMFYDVWAAKGLLKKKLGGDTTAWRETRKMEVFLLKDRDDYIDTLQQNEANIGVSVGYYNAVAKKSFFYPSESLDATFFHELTHQLFSESSQFESVFDVGSSGGVWLLEGVAVYMESLRDHDHFWTVGGVEAPRMQTARYRAVRDGYWPEWRTFVAGTIDAWKQDPNVAMNYSHAAGLTHSLLDLHAERKKTRAMYLAALEAVYAGRGDAGVELLTLLGDDDMKAKIAYQDMMTISDEQALALQQSDVKPRELVLAGSKLEATTWAGFADQTELRWLDVSFSNITQADMAWLSDFNELERLSVEGTAVDGRILPIVNRLRKLNELDLSGCAISDTELESLRGNAAIQTLWITNTRVTNASLNTLASLRNLRMCDVSGTQIEAEAWMDFERRHLRAKP